MQVIDRVSFVNRSFFIKSSEWTSSYSQLDNNLQVNSCKLTKKCISFGGKLIKLCYFY